MDLQWTAAHGEGETRLERKAGGEAAWRALHGGWLAPTDEFLDETADGLFGYRVVLRDPLGRFVFSDVELSDNLSS